MLVFLGVLLPLVTFALALIERRVERNTETTAHLKTKRTLVALLLVACIGSASVAVRQALDSKDQDRQLKTVQAALRDLRTQQSSIAESQTRMETLQAEAGDESILGYTIQEHILEGYLNAEISADDPTLQCCLRMEYRSGKINGDDLPDFVTWFVFNKEGENAMWMEGIAVWLSSEDDGLRYAGLDVIGGRFGGHLEGIEFGPGRVTVTTKADPMTLGEGDGQFDCTVRTRIRCK